MDGKDRKAPRVLIVDAQGGGIGRQLVSAVRKAVPGAWITAVGTNGAATANMLKASPDAAATGENAVVVGARKSGYILGPVGIAITDSMEGEVTPTMAAAVAQSPAVRILIPFDHCDTYIAGTGGIPTGKLIAAAVEELRRLASGDGG